ncbi:MAG: DUF1926 domain-containing protein [Helicobacteraceae bacterium]|nr:DUF1926 domain-containing protein [Helicobacteraceae bacterium]
MKKTSLLLGVHSHQPVGNFDHVVLGAIAQSYRPFFETLSQYSDFKFSAHFSGWLLEFIKTHDRPLFDLMKKMSERGQIEWFSGGYYEPILASIPSRDRRRQIEKLSGFIHENFGTNPKGLWLTERVWESSIVGDLCDLGIEYVIIDDYHLLTAGADPRKLNGYYVTESGGKSLLVFPVSKALRYQVPFWDYNVVANNIADFGGAAVIFDDGEKFGTWPGTSEWVYKKRWLENFIEAVLDHDGIKTRLYGEYRGENAPIGLIYPSEVAYAEMGEWSLSADAALRIQTLRQEMDRCGRHDDAELFVRGATWKNFLVKFHESARIHRRMLSLSAKNPLDSPPFEDALLKAECNDVLWHGVFGGLYLPNLRDNAWKFLIEAEDMIAPQSGIVYEDWNLDAFDEARFYDSNLIVGFEPRGGTLTELHLRRERFNLLNTLTRYREAYHGRIRQKNEEIDGSGGAKTIHESTLTASEDALRHLVADRNQRVSFVDHLVEDDFDAESFFLQSYKEDERFSDVIYSLGGDDRRCRLTSAKIAKSISVENGAIVVETSVKTGAKRYMQEHNLHFANLSEVTINGVKADEARHFSGISALDLFDPYLNKNVLIASNAAFEAFTHPLYTVSQSESGVDLTCQGIAIALLFAASTVTVTINIKETL